MTRAQHWDSGSRGKGVEWEEVAESGIRGSRYAWMETGDVWVGG